MSKAGREARADIYHVEARRMLMEAWYFIDQAGHRHAYQRVSDPSGWRLTLPTLVDNNPDGEKKHLPSPDWRCRECGAPVRPLTPMGAQAIDDFIEREDLDWFVGRS